MISLHMAGGCLCENAPGLRVRTDNVEIGAMVAPKLPTIAESGVKGYAVDAWFGIVAPAGVPKELVAKLNAAIVNGLKSADVKQRFGDLGYESIGDSPEQFAATIRADIEKFGRVIKAAGIKAD